MGKYETVNQLQILEYLISTNPDNELYQIQRLHKLKELKKHWKNDKTKGNN